VVEGGAVEEEMGRGRGWGGRDDR